MKPDRGLQQEGYTVVEQLTVLGMTVMLAAIVAGVVIMVHFITKYW